MKLSDYVFQFVADQGVKHVFLVTGGGAMHLNASLAAEKRIEPICNSHEQASAMCAESYAKAVNGLGVALVTTGPGGTNAVTGVAGAWLDSTPTLFLSGQVKRPDRMFDQTTGKALGMRQLGVQEVDIVSIVKPITKYAVVVVEPLDIRYELEKALYLALNGRPGPVWIDIPLDVQASPIPDPSTLQSFDPKEHESSNENLKAEVERVVEELQKATRPLLFAGNGTRLARAEKQFTELRELLDIPTVATWCAADLVPSDVPTFVGRPGNVAARGANFALQNSDFLLVLGARMDMAITGYAPQNLAREAYKVAVDIDPSELQKLYPHLQQPIVSDARAFLDELLSQLRALKQPLNHDRWASWNKRAADWKTRYDVVTDEHRKPEGLVSIFNLAEVIGTESKPDDKLVSGSSGSGIEIFLLACPTRSGQRIFHTAGLGSMGYGLPMSIGVCIGSGRKTTILVDGDGGFQFNIQELETVSRLKLPVKLFVLNNDGYASIRASQKAYFGSAQIGADASTGLTVPDITKVANSYGIPAIIIKDQTNLREEVRQVLAMDGPVVIDVRVIPDEVRAPRLQSYQKEDGSFVSKPLEDMFPFLSREEFLENMIVKPLPE
jgi:acetolactate synthase I/II/III large subunit